MVSVLAPRSLPFLLLGFEPWIVVFISSFFSLITLKTRDSLGQKINCSSRARGLKFCTATQGGIRNKKQDSFKTKHTKGSLGKEMPLKMVLHADLATTKGPAEQFAFATSRDLVSFAGKLRESIRHAIQNI